MTRWKKGRVADYMYEFPSVAYWMDQLREVGVRNVPVTQIGTKAIYILKLRKFNEWLVGREFDVRVQMAVNSRIIHEIQRRSFANVEELLRFGEDGNVNEVKKIVNQYMSDPQHDHLSRSSMMGICAAIRSYFDINDVKVDIKFNGRKRDDAEVTDDSELTISEFYNMLVYGRIDHTVRAMMLVTLQTGLDSNTLADRFNYQAYPQISKFCGTTDYEEWNLDKCPIPISLVHAKTGVRFTTFIDRDALSAIKNYLDWRKETRGPHDIDGPLFLTTRDKPISVTWISDIFDKLAKDTELQKKIGPRKNKITSHEVRDLLKTTLIQCGCPEHMADHIMGHKPRDFHMKISDPYPEQLRHEYAKASYTLNIFSRVERGITNLMSLSEMKEIKRQNDLKIEELKKRINETEAKRARQRAMGTATDTHADETIASIPKHVTDAIIDTIVEAINDPNHPLVESLREKLRDKL